MHPRMGTQYFHSIPLIHFQLQSIIFRSFWPHGCKPGIALNPWIGTAKTTVANCVTHTDSTTKSFKSNRKNKEKAQPKKVSASTKTGNCAFDWRNVASNSILLEPRIAGKSRHVTTIIIYPSPSLISYLARALDLISLACVIVCAWGLVRMQIVQSGTIWLQRSSGTDPLLLPSWRTNCNLDLHDGELAILMLPLPLQSLGIHPFELTIYSRKVPWIHPHLAPFVIH